jgi:hypothetical protein
MGDQDVVTGLGVAACIPRLVGVMEHRVPTRLPGWDVSTGHHVAAGMGDQYVVMGDDGPASIGDQGMVIGDDGPASIPNTGVATGLGMSSIGSGRGSMSRTQKQDQGQSYQDNDAKRF